MRIRPVLSAAVCLCAASVVWGQEQTLVGSGDISHGGYGAPVVKLTSIAGESAVIAGGRGGWIINHTVVIGGGGYGLSTRVDAPTPGPFGERYLDFGYGGLMLEYIIASDRLVHGALDVLVGAGGVTHRRDWDDDEWDDVGGRSDALTVIEPGGTLELNVTPWFRASAGASYRFVAGSRRRIASNDDLSGFSATFALKFGKF